MSTPRDLVQPVAAPAATAAAIDAASAAAAGRLTADDLKRGVCRALAAHGFATLTEFSLANGRRADVIGVGGDGDVVIVEVKSSLADYQSDHKWPDYIEFCDRFYFAVAADFPHALVPLVCGLWVADGYGAEELRAAPRAPMHASRRRALTLRVARAAAMRLHLMLDPWLASSP
jgi:hypothetical protein